MEVWYQVMSSEDLMWIMETIRCNHGLWYGGFNLGIWRKKMKNQRGSLILLPTNDENVPGKQSNLS